MRAFLATVLAVTILGGCSVPMLESETCAGSRNELRQFYSYHFGHAMLFSAAELEQRRKFLTPEYYESLGGSPADADAFTTGTGDTPKTFRIGACEELSPERTRFAVLIFWKDDVRDEQRTIHADMKLVGDRWLVDKIETR